MHFWGIWGIINSVIIRNETLFTPPTYFPRKVFEKVHSPIEIDSCLIFEDNCLILGRSLVWWSFFGPSWGHWRYHKNIDSLGIIGVVTARIIMCSINFLLVHKLMEISSKLINTNTHRYLTKFLYGEIYRLLFTTVSFCPNL